MEHMEISDNCTLDGVNNDKQQLMTESNSERYLLLLSLYGCVPWNPEGAMGENILQFAWYAIAKLALLASVIYLFGQWFTFLHRVKEPGEAFLLSIAFSSSILSAVVFLIPQWFTFMNPIDIGFFINYDNSKNSSKSFDNKVDFQNSWKSSSGRFSTDSDSLGKSSNSFSSDSNRDSKQNRGNLAQLQARMSAVHKSFIFFIVATILTEVGEALDITLNYQSDINQFYPIMHAPITMIGEFFVGCSQAGFLAIFMYRLLMAEHLLLAVRRRMETQCLTGYDIDMLRKDFDTLFGRKDSSENTFYGVVMMTGFWSILAAMVRFVVTPNLLGFINAIVYFGKTIIFTVVIFRFAGHLNSLCDELKQKIAMENVKNDIEQVCVAISLQAKPLSISFFGFQPSESLYLWQLFGVTITFGFRLLHGLAGL